MIPRRPPPAEVVRCLGGLRHLNGLRYLISPRLLGGWLAVTLLIATAAAETLNVRHAEENLADAVYHDEFLRDLTSAANLYQEVLNDASATRSERHTAGWRLGRIWRRLNHPAEARARLSSLLNDSELPEDLRQIVERELQLLPRSHPALLMADDSLVYLEVPQPGIFLQRCISLARQSGLERALTTLGPLRFQNLGNIALLGSVDIGSFLNPDWRFELGKLDALGLAWRHFRFKPVGDQLDATSEVVCALHTGGNSDTVDALEKVLQNWISPLTGSGPANLLLPGLNPQLKLARSAGLLVLSSSENEAQATIQRFEKADSSGILASTAAYQQRPDGWPHPDSLFLFVNWPPLLKQVIDSLPAVEARPLQTTVELLGLNTLGPIFGMLQLTSNELMIELDLELTDPLHPLNRMLRTQTLPQDWSQWVPDDAWFAFATTMKPGDERWQLFQEFTGELDQYRSLSPTAKKDEQEPTSFTELWREFEDRTGISIADDLCRDVQTLTVVAQPAGADEDEQWSAPWVFVLEVNEPERWVRQAQIAIGRWNYIDVTEDGLPTTTELTPVGTVTRYSPLMPYLNTGPAWQVRGQRVIFAFGVETLMRYLQSVPSLGGSDHTPDGRRPCKYFRFQVGASLIGAQYLFPLSRNDAGTSSIPSYEIWTQETEQRVQVTFRQRSPHLALRYLADKRFGITPLPPVSGESRSNK